MDLNELAFQRIKELQRSKDEVISYKKIRSKICTTFSIRKELCQKLLIDFKKEGRIKLTRKGIRMII
jgi:Mn-dependent DtxR family transcriptional regulator